MCVCANPNKGMFNLISLISDINECLNPDTCPSEQCENTPGSYECVPCLPGHEARSGTCYGECQPMWLSRYQIQIQDKVNHRENHHDRFVLHFAKIVLGFITEEHLRSTHCRGKRKDVYLVQDKY